VKIIRKNRKKGIITMLEMIGSVLVLIIAFSIFFPTLIFKNKWNEATLLLRTRDFLLTMDRLGVLYNYSFDSNLLSNFSLQVLDPNLIVFSETQGALKSDIVVACNCTEDQILNLSTSLGRLKLNNRDIFITFTKTDDLNNIPPSDVLLIWGYKNLSSYYNSLLNYLDKGNGIIETMDFHYQTQGNPVDDDIVQTRIFGLKWIDLDKDQIEYIEFNRTPNDIYDPIYEPYKYFYNFPLPSKTNTSESISGCDFDPSGKGYIFFNDSYYAYWICSSNSIWIDNNGDGIRDNLITVESGFELSENNYNFTLNYVEDNSSVFVSFKPTYKFNDFLGYVAPPGEPSPPGKGLGTNRVYYIGPIDDNWNRVLLKGTAQAKEYPASIVNTTSGNRVAWIADLLGDSNDDFGDDKKQILLSLLLWGSNKISKESLTGVLKAGYITPYINIGNRDMFEVYRINLGLGFPY
jgi:hypothetical protein